MDLNFEGFGLVLDLLGHPVMTHFCTPIPIHDQSKYLSSLVIWVYSDWKLFEMIARSSAYAGELTVSSDVPNIYPLLPLCSQRSSGSRNMRNRYGLMYPLGWCLFVLGLVLFFRSVHL